MHLYSDWVMAEIKVNYAAYKATLQDGEEPREWWGFATAEARRLLEKEDNDVKAAVEAYRQLQVQSSKPTVFDIHHLTAEGAEAATKRVRDLQQKIKKLARTAYQACKALEDQTGWKASMFLGGPNPETRKLVTVTVHNGRTVDLQNIFSDTTEKWSMIQTEWDTFVARCYKADLAPMLERFYRGEPDDSNIPALVDLDAQPPAETTVPTAAVSSTTTTPIPASHPDAAPLAVASGTTAEAESPAPATAVPKNKAHSDALDYFYECQANVARNAEILKRVVRGEKYDDIVRALDLDIPLSNAEEEEEEEVPAWVEKGKEYLEGVSEEEWWQELVSAWFEFERALGFPESQAQSNWLSPKARPEEVKYWISRGRKYDKPPKIKSLPAFVAQFREWWARIQPSERRDPDELWPLLKKLPEDPARWSDVKRGGCNGVFMDEEDHEELQEAVDDIHWVLRTFVPAAVPVTAPAPTPAPAIAPAESEPAVSVVPSPEPVPVAATTSTPATASSPISVAGPAHAPALSPAETVSTMSLSLPPPISAPTASEAAPAPAAFKAAPTPAVSEAAPAPALSEAAPARAVSESDSAPGSTVAACEQLAGSKRPVLDPAVIDQPAAKKLHVDNVTTM